jgi:hypothetical protein
MRCGDRKVVLEVSCGAKLDQCDAGSPKMTSAISAKAAQGGKSSYTVF